MSQRQLTLRGFDPELERRIRDLAEREGLSLNKAALKLLRRGAGLERPPSEPTNAIGSALDDCIGTWTDEETEEVRERAAHFDRVDEELWR